MFRSQLIQEIRSFEQLKLVDVREIEEYENEGHIPHAINIPLSTLPQSLNQLEKEREYYVVCYSGSRSQMACDYLSTLGYQVINLLGGMSAYRGRLE